MASKTLRNRSFACTLKAMVDLHHHLLPGLDDGSPDLPTSVAMARTAVEDGITHVVCTPHASDRYAFDPALVAARRTELSAALAQAGIALQLGTGCDFHLNYDNIQDALQHPRRYTVNGSEYLLIELPDYSLSANLPQTFYDLRVAGMTPILTHPERNPTLQNEPGRLREWIEAGLLTQVTAASVLGTMGRPAKKLALDLLRTGQVHFIATDAHNLRTRPPQMRAAFKAIASRFSPEYAEQLCVANPLAVFYGRSLPEQTAPLRAPDQRGGAGLSWWQRLLQSR